MLQRIAVAAIHRSALWLLWCRPCATRGRVFSADSPPSGVALVASADRGDPDQLSGDRLVIFDDGQPMAEWGQ
jgi:hypothetical protein